MTAAAPTAAGPTLDELLAGPPYALPQPEKERVLLGHLNALTERHRGACAPYARALAATGGGGPADSLAGVPWLPVQVFKSHRLRSVPEAEVFKTLTSSGTTGQAVSQILLDRETAGRQTRALARIMTHVLGPDRLPMLVADTRGVVTDRARFSARGAGVLGMASFGRAHAYALDEQMRPDEAAIAAFLERFAGGPFLMFGFTFMVWQYLYRPLRDRGLDLSNGVLVHSGGWKTLQAQAVGNPEFRRALGEAFGLRRIYNFYGMVEQVGSVFLEGEDGFLYPPAFADVIVRDPVTWREAPVGVPGVIQVLSALPTSYPGHSILTEDLGVVHGVDDSSCGRFGKRFSVLGRVPKAELRGCSDAHAAAVAA